MEIFFAHLKHPEVIYLQIILNSNLFYHKHTQVKKRKIPKNNDIFTFSFHIKIYYHKTMKHISQSFSQNAFYPVRYFQSFLWFCLDDFSFFMSLVEVHFFSVVFLVKYSLPCVISFGEIKKEINILLKIYLLVSFSQSKPLFFVLFYCLDLVLFTLKFFTF